VGKRVQIRIEEVEEKKKGGVGAAWSRRDAEERKTTEFFAQWKRGKKIRENRLTIPSKKKEGKDDPNYQLSQEKKNTQKTTWEKRSWSFLSARGKGRVAPILGCLGGPKDDRGLNPLGNLWGKRDRPRGGVIITLKKPPK